MYAFWQSNTNSQETVTPGIKPTLNLALFGNQPMSHETQKYKSNIKRAYSVYSQKQCHNTGQILLVENKTLCWSHSF